MKEAISTLTEKVRKAIDDVQSSLVDDFADDANAEIRQALRHAADSLCQALPLGCLDYTKETCSRQLGIMLLPTAFMRFVSFEADGWSGAVRLLVEPGSDEEKMQRSTWSCGTASKPKAMLDENGSGRKALRTWPSVNAGTLCYIPKVSIVTESGVEKLQCALKDEYEKNLVFLAASVYLEGKNEHALADNFSNLSKL